MPRRAIHGSNAVKRRISERDAQGEREMGSRTHTQNNNNRTSDEMERVGDGKEEGQRVSDDKYRYRYIYIYISIFLMKVERRGRKGARERHTQQRGRQQRF